MAKNDIRRQNPFVAIGASLGGILLAMVIFISIFASQQLWIVTIVAACFIALGGILAYYAAKAK